MKGVFSTWWTKFLKAPDGSPSDVEGIKDRSNYLRGTLKEVMLDRMTAGIPEDDNRLMKHHGSYLQDDRDLRNERQKQKLEPAYQFMLRVRLPGGVASSDQWLVMDDLAQKKYGNGTLKLTTRETFQIHGIFKMEHETNDSRNPCIYDGYDSCMR
ncbi:hypothetical protein GCM10020331_051940 [Ectobacillus funiculus]